MNDFQAGVDEAKEQYKDLLESAQDALHTCWPVLLAMELYTKHPQEEDNAATIARKKVEGVLIEMKGRGI